MFFLPLVFAQVIPLTQVNSMCPVGYYGQTGYCIPTKSINSYNQSINSSGNTCPVGTYRNNGYCTGYRNP
jgi:hypothetical protein